MSSRGWNVFLADVRVHDVEWDFDTFDDYERLIKGFKPNVPFNITVSVTEYDTDEIRNCVTDELEAKFPLISVWSVDIEILSVRASPFARQ